MSESSVAVVFKGRKRFFFAFIIALAGLALAVAVAVYTWKMSEQVKAYQNDFDHVHKRLDEINRLKQEIGVLREQQQALLSVRAELTAYRAQLVAQLDKLAGVYQDEWLIAEAANYVRMAEQRLVLGRDPAGSVTFLAAADEVLDRAGLVGTDVARRAIASDMLKLSRASLDNAGRERAMYMVDLLMEQASDLSMNTQEWEWTYGAESHRADVDASSTLNQPVGFLASVKRFLFSLVTVRRHAPGRPLVAEPQMRIYFEQNYQMLLQYLLVSALKNDGDAFKRGVERTQAWLNEFFDHEDRMVRVAYSQLEQMKAIKWDVLPEDLSYSRRAIAALHQSWKTSGATPPSRSVAAEEASQ